MSASFDSLESEYLLEMEKARQDREKNGDYTKAGLRCFVNAARIQFQLASMSTRDQAVLHRQIGEQIIRDIHDNMFRLGMIAPSDAPASDAVPDSSGDAKDVSPSKPAVRPAPTVSPELEDFSIDQYLVKPNEVSVADAEQGNLEAMKHLEWAIYDPLADKFPNLAISFDKEEIKHLLLYGPPGTGKTFLCKAAATYLNEKYPDDSAFFLLPCGEIKSKYVGTTEHRIRAVFDAAAQYEHAVICIDEVDSICPTRTDEVNKQNYTTVLLELIDGVKGKTNSIVILATNHPDHVDSALISRIGNRAFLDYPSKEQIGAILRRKTAILEAVGTTDQERQEAIGRIAALAAQQHFSFRNVNVLVTALQNSMREKLFKQYPGGTDERITSIQLTKQEIDAALSSVSSDYDPEEYRELLRYRRA